MNKDLQSKLSMLENLISIQHNCLDAGYMHGMLNGLIVAHSVFADSRPKFVSMPRKLTNVRHKKRKR